MKGLRVILTLLFIATPVFHSTANFIDNITPYLINPNSKSKNKKNKGSKEDTKEKDNLDKTRVTAENRYSKSLDDVRYIAFYYSNKAASTTYKKAESKLTKFYKKLDKKNKQLENPIMEVIFVNRDFNEKDMAVYSFPHLDYMQSKKNISANKFAGRSFPSLVVVSRSGGIMFGGHINTVVDKLDTLIDFDDVEGVDDSDEESEE